MTVAPQSGRVTILLRFHHGPQIAAQEVTPEGVPSVPGCAETTRPVVEVSGLLRYR